VFGQQAQPWRGASQQSPPAAEKRQLPGVPIPTLRQQPAPAQATPRPPVQPPFVLTPEQQAQVDQVLKAWEQSSSRVKTFECDFTRWEYDPVFGPANKAKFEDQGQVRYGAPDKGRFEVKGERAELWASNGRSIFAFDYQQRKVVEHRLPPELQGKAIADGPLPFLFGAKAETLKRRYLVRIITPPNRLGEVWLEAYPRFQADAANYQRVELILTVKDMLPAGMQIHLPNGKTRISYQFYNIAVNSTNWLRVLERDPFNPRTPTGWTKIVEQAPTSQASRQKPATGPR
jgi:TIGR03009 family protein